LAESPLRWLLFGYDSSGIVIFVERLFIESRFGAVKEKMG
jgi:hypothetical protein